MNWLLDPYRELHTYRVAGYLLLGLPIGIVEFVAIVTGLSMGFGLLITLLGIPVLVMTLLGARACASFERELARTLLDAPMPRHQPRPDRSTGFFWRRLVDLVTDRDTWAGIAFMLLRLPLGIIDFTVVVTIVSLALGGFANPILFLLGLEYTAIGDFVIDTFAESLIYLPFSIVFLLDRSPHSLGLVDHPYPDRHRLPGTAWPRRVEGRGRGRALPYRRRRRLPDLRRAPAAIRQRTLPQPQPGRSCIARSRIDGTGGGPPRRRPDPLDPCVGRTD